MNSQDLAVLTEDLTKGAVYMPGLLTAKDVCDIISACRKNGVLSLRLGELVLEFTELSKDRTKSQKRGQGAEPAAPVPEQFSPYKQSEGDTARDLDVVTDPDLLLVEDPVAYEKWHIEQQDEAN